MTMLKTTNSGVYEAFNEFGCFVVSRSKRPFSSMGLDQRHEQHNKDIKDDGGVLGLTEDQDKFQRWMTTAFRNTNKRLPFKSGSQNTLTV